MRPFSDWRRRDSLSHAEPIVIEDRLYWNLFDKAGRNIRFVVNWGSGRIYVFDQTAEIELLSK